ncbi:MAG: ABC transporter substrate-binding protein [Acidimicrobiales bacterium]|nr:ABC transporter substrate-binding protein [Acidimicrobiales bacterium]
MGVARNGSGEGRPRVLLRSCVGMAVAAALLVGCGGSDSESTAAKTTVTTSEGEFTPVTIEHVFGTTEITERPQRIVSLDPQWTDVLLAMGETPVGFVSSPQFGERGTFPWQEDLLANSEPITYTDGVPVEAVAKLRPDLVLATYALESKADYEKLAGQFDVVASPTEEQVQKWEDLTDLTGKILGEPAAAERVVEKVTKTVDSVVSDLPGLKGKTIAFANYYAPGNQLIVLSDPDDGANVLFSRLGLELAPGILALGEGVNGRAELSLEQIDALDGDILLALTNGTDTADIVGWDTLPAVEAGTAKVLDTPTAWALNSPSPLSVPWAIEQIRPTLASAAN